MPASKALTTKQAKASFKARNNPTISETERRWLDRAAELDQRAVRRLEQDRRRAEAAKKKAEKEKHDKLQREELQLGTQRRLDRFGHKSSQFHLGNFFGKHTALQSHGTNPTANIGDSFEDDDVNDAALLEALETIAARTGDIEQTQNNTSNAESVAGNPSRQALEAVKASQHKQALVPANSSEDLSRFWDEMDSSTQIARELEDKLPLNNPCQNVHDSFGFSEFDLTLEDLDALDQLEPPESEPEPQCTIIQRAHLRRVSGQMPPPPLPAKRSAPGLASIGTSDVEELQAAADGAQNAMKQDPAAFSLVKNARSGPSLRSARQTRTGHGHKSVPRVLGRALEPASIGLTSTQLENFVDDDLQLTQAAPY